MSHLLDLDDSFKDNISELKNPARGEIGSILSSLEDDPFFEPGSEYLFQRSPKDQHCVCSSRCWDSWKLVWYYEYSSLMPSTVEVIVLMLVREPSELSTIKPRTL
ncbi:MAG: hypothetical protein WA824_12495 [Candidatus Sulfotelmatobacter sp.]